ncbi:hypothetical protein K4749_34370 [Streptomyces sp. TRM72054]|uniref:hypothetical protein n=1 Tax=Streptomyces sp. TRM72054 TaxID=2870562 RepID=UPI001C8BF6ED|nr:hypothetical protein [Streptomyces sp. TRM72054]MBX9398532.1 hypothetical protein [Streptomyces sp. TRM72054]
MLTYQDVVTVDIGALNTATKAWSEMATGFGELEDLYTGKVEAVATDGVWVGVSAGAAQTQFSATRQQFAHAQVEAKAISGILRDAHEQFVTLIGHVKAVVEDAKKNEMSVNAKGEAIYDFSKLTPMRHDPDYPKHVSKMKEAEASWTKAIKDAVQAVDDADQGVKLALHEAAGIKSWFERVFDDPFGRGHTFNGSAVGDIEVYEAREARKYADQILAGEKPNDAELAEWERLMRDNSGDRVFSQTLLNSLGPDDTLKLSNKINDFAYFDDTGHKKSYLQINGGLSDSLATATRVPDFQGADGKRLRFGTAEYNEAFSSWKKTDDARFYSKWREALREHGDDKYDLKAAGDKIDMAKGANQQIRGYQSLATLMQQGDGYSPQFVADVTDDMIAMEKKDPDIWDLYGRFGGKGGDGWFANDPVDATLGVMSRNPEGAAGYLDPGTAAGQERFDYLLGKGDGSRDWNLVNTTEWRGNIEVPTSDVADGDSRKGLGDALVAAATGVDPAGPQPQGETTHSAVNDRVFVHALEVLSDQGDDMPASLREDMAKVMVSHGEEVYVAMSDPSGRREPENGPKLEAEQVMEMSKQISRSKEAYGMLHEGMNYSIIADFHDSSRKPEDTLSSAGYAIGFMEEARYNALKGDQHDYTWDKAWSYHGSGAILNFIPVYGDIAQRGADMVTTAWIMDEQKKQADELTSNNQATYESRRNQLNALADEWYFVNSDWAESHTGYSRDDGLYKQIAAAANDGNALADAQAGDQ